MLINLIKKAHQKIMPVISQTPVIHSASFSSIYKKRIFLKLENLQKTGSFKVRGAYFKIASLSKKGLKNGVITASSGNHAQGVAWAARVVGCTATVFMPETAPISKQTATRGYGARIIIAGRSFSDAYDFAKAFAAEKGLEFIEPFDDELVIAGQGTIGLEVLKDLPPQSMVVVPVGGGGLIAGIAAVLKEQGRRIKVIGVEAETSTSCIESLKAGRPVDSKRAVASGVLRSIAIADGIAVKRVGERTLPLIKKYVDDVISVREDSIAEAILKLLERKKIIAEGAGAVTLAAVMEGRLPKTSGNTMLILSGGNIDVSTLDRIIRRGLIREGRVVRIEAALTDVAGSLAAFTKDIALLRANILHIRHLRDASDAPVGVASMDVMLEVEGRTHASRVLRRLREKGYDIKAQAT